MFGFQHTNGSGERRGEAAIDASVSDPNEVAPTDLLVQFDDVGIAHENAPAADGFPNPVLVLGTVDIDVPLVGIHIAPLINPGLQPPQPEYPARDKVASKAFVTRKLREMAPCRHPCLENNPGRLACPNSLGDFMEASRGAQGVGDIGGRISGSGYGI
jgi:hypothetical protein